MTRCEFYVRRNRAVGGAVSVLGRRDEGRSSPGVTFNKAPLESNNAHTCYTDTAAGAIEDEHRAG